ncbi:Predicted Zn-dependent peptidase [Ferrimonas sediminum]|uniref:Predicted Zn-dependent peptidase n=1 Tax=Ferrimonas sediminum TaxID=718193 RepID=A0A1G8XHC3_9GAMM|nr:pitrilysin family protein [Ferrimonas sediminum]SDJ89826.1 Predicted Zn-dependent peptidase [Ferrimonas sediminum]
MKQLLTPALALTLTLMPALAQASEPSEVQSFTLDNGMKILVLEDHAIPNANMYLFWKVGSRNEVPGITGLSHFFEHMMFNGSKNYGPKMFDRTMEAAGGANNAYTTENVTVYTDWFPADAIETIFKLESDRIAHLNIDANMVESERNVVASERTTGLENSNWRSLQEEVKATAFRAHPYSWSVIGHESDIYAWTLDDLKQYHKTYYAPNNAVVVIAGAVEFEQVKALSEHYFGTIPAQAPPAKVRTVEPEQKGERRVYVRKESVTSPNLMFAYHVPETQHQDSYALDVLISLLIDGNSSRLNKALVDEQQLALGIDGYVPESFDPNLLYLFAVAKPGVTADTLEQAMITEINKVAAGGVTQDELDKVKNAKLMGFYDTLETINGRANTLGTYELFQGDWRKMYSAPEAYAKVTREDVQRVARSYLKKSNRTVGVLAAEEDNDQ